MSFTEKMPGHLMKHCPDVNLAEIEWKSKADRAVMPYGVLVRVWEKGNDPHAEAYSSPVDGKSGGRKKRRGMAAVAGGRGEAAAAQAACWEGRTAEAADRTRAERTRNMYDMSVTPEVSQLDMPALNWFKLSKR